MSSTMKIIILLFAFSVVSCEHFCYNSTKSSCAKETKGDIVCTAKYGQAHHYMESLRKYANIHITRNFQYLLMSTHFGSYKVNRDGFKKLYRKLSDSAWEDAIELIKYITKRGGKMNFHYDDDPSIEFPEDMTELLSLAKSVDVQKELALRAHNIYRSAHVHDPEVSAFVQDHFMQKHSKIIRDLAGYTIDLARLLGDKDGSNVGLKIFILDSVLQKVV